MRFPLTSSVAAVACLVASTTRQPLPMMATDDLRAAPQPSPLQRSLVAVASSPWVSHQASLPLLTRQLISSRAQSIFSFVLAYLEDAALDVDVHASGGYVRDLLLGRLSDDLDLALCLIRCPPDVTIQTIARGMVAFAGRHRCDVGTGCTIDGAEVVTSLSEAARDKGLDTAQMCITFGDESCHVDLMPTVGMETYDGDDRIPVRDARGTVEADALRRDLTIGAMLLH
eukprot:3990090-Prymnesium_polylepis.1